MPGKSALFFSLCAGLALSVSATAASVTPATPVLDEADNCYQISNAAELYGFVAITNGQGVTKDVSACGKLTKDITINAGVLNSDGTLNSGASADFATWTPMASFSGTFDGQGHKISGLYFNNSSTSNVGFVNVLTGGSVEKPVTIKNLEIADSYIRGSSNVAGFAVYAQSGVVQISNSVFSSVIDAKYVSGGFVSRAAAGSTLYIDNCLFNGKISAQTNTGGFVGQTLQGKLFLNNSVSVGSVVYTGTGSALQYGVKVLFGNKYSGSATIENSFYLESEGIGELGGFAATAEQLADGSVTKALRIFKDQSRDVDGFVWGQKVGTDAYPILSGKLEGYTGTTASIVFHTFSGDKNVYASEYVPGYKVTLPNASREGYQFMGWYANSSFTGSVMTEIPSNASGTQEFWAKFSKIYNVTLNVADGKVDSADVTEYTEGIGAALPKKVSRTGYVFRGWTLDGDESGAFVDSVTTAMSGNLKFTAVWFAVKTPVKNSAGCYEVSDAAELYGLAGLTNGIYGITKTSVACAKLTADIKVNEGVLKTDGTLDSSKIAKLIRWTPITEFSGEFDGQGNTISGIFSMYDGPNGGLFGSLKGGTAAKPVTLKNVGLVDSYFYSTSYTGGFVGGTEQSAVILIENCYNNANVVSDYYAAGVIGFVNYLGDATIVNCYNLGTIYGQNSAGISAHQGSTVTLKVLNCYNLGSVSAGNSNNFKMLVKSKPAYLTIENSFYLKANGKKELGGLPATPDQFEDGSVATRLKEGSFVGFNGEIWGQNVGVDKSPLLTKELKNSKAVKKSLILHTYEGDVATYQDHYVVGFSMALPTPTREKYTFAGWFDNAEFSGSKVDSVLATATTDKEFWAKFERTYTVTLNVNGGTISSEKVNQYVEGTGAVLPQSVTRNGYIFMGWYESSDFSGFQVKTISAADKGDKVYYANWMTVKVPQVENDCYVISDLQELYTYAAIVNGTSGYSQYPYVCGTLSADITVNENVLKDDGTLDSARMETFVSWDPLNNVTGSFDGRGHTISGLYINNASKDYVGFFGRVNGGYSGSPVVIKNLKIKDSYFRARNSVGGVVSTVNSSKMLKMDSVSFDGVILSNYEGGGLVGYNNGTLEILNSRTSGYFGTGEASAYNTSIGGLVGNSSNPLSISNSANYATIAGKNYDGGLVGYSSATLMLSESFNEGSVIGESNEGGLVGYMVSTASIINSYNKGNVNALSNNVGGLVGYNSVTLNLIQSYNEASVAGKNYVGGLVGFSNQKFYIANCYNLGDINSANYAGGLLGYANQSSSYFGDSYLLNNYTMGEVSGTKDVDAVAYIVMGTGADVSKIAANNFYLNYEGVAESKFGTAKEKEAFADTTVTKELRAFVQKNADGVAVEGGINGLVWGQDSIPMLVTKEYYALNFTLNGGKLEKAPVTYKYGDELELPLPTREGYKFAGWFKDAGFGSAEQAVTKINETDFGNKMFYALWEILEFKVTVSVNNEKAGYVTGLKKDGKYTYNELLSLTAVPADGYYFTDWTSDVDEIKSEQIFTYVESDMTLVANFEKVEESSSSAEPESSSAENVSSSSSEKLESSSSEQPASSSSEKDAIDVVGPIPQFALTAAGRDIQVAGARVGNAYAVLDMQGRVLTSGRVSASSFNITLGRVGSYLVRVGTQAKTVRLR